MAPGDWLRIAQSDERVARALRVFAQGSVRWSDLYHAFEIVEATVGRQMYDERWIARDEANLFSWTANSPGAIREQARHGNERHDPPPNPMSEEDAGRIIRDLVRHWLEWTVQQQP